MPERRCSRRRLLAALGTAAAVGTAGCAAAPGARQVTTDTSTESPTETPPETTPRETRDPAAAPGDDRFAHVYREAIDSVVSLRVYGTDGTRGQGSGIVYDDGYLLTNQHVVGNAQQIYARFQTGDWYTPQVAGVDVYSDLAVLELDDPPEYAEPLPFVDEEPEIGQEVVALGNPFGLDESVSAGIISGVDRSLPGANDFTIADAIQTDAAVNPGNSGGPLMSLDSEVIGLINSGGGDNIAFAISYALIDRIAPALIEDGNYDHPYIGVTIQGVTPTVAEANGLEEARGVLVVSVPEDGPSDGVLEGSDGSERVNGTSVPVGGDVIVALDGQPVPTQDDLSTYLALNKSPGESLELTVIRDGERQTVETTLGTRPDP